MDDVVGIITVLFMFGGTAYALIKYRPRRGGDTWKAEVTDMTTGQRTLLWIVGIGAILLGLGLLGERFSGLDVADTLFVLVAIGGGVFALFKAMSRGEVER